MIYLIGEPGGDFESPFDDGRAYVLYGTSSTNAQGAINYPDVENKFKLSDFSSTHGFYLQGEYATEVDDNGRTQIVRNEQFVGNYVLGGNFNGGNKDELITSSVSKKPTPGFGNLNIVTDTNSIGMTVDELNGNNGIQIKYDIAATANNKPQVAELTGDDLDDLILIENTYSPSNSASYNGRVTIIPGISSLSSLHDKSVYSPEQINNKLTFTSTALYDLVGFKSNDRRS